MDFPKRLRSLRLNQNMTQEELGKKINVTKVSVSGYENGNRVPDMETLQKIADVFDVQVDYLLGRTDDPTPPQKSKPYYALTEKDERDIARDLERMMSDLQSNEAMAFYGEPMDEETRELIRLSLENSMRLAKEMAKKKFTPKKYRKDT